jgi:hypothetical protein
VNREASFTEIRAVALAEMLDVAVGAHPLGRRAAGAALGVAASALARSLVDLDRDLGRGALPEAARRRLAHYGVKWRTEGDPPPARGPVVVVSNHPGLFDALALFAAIDRDDLAVLAARRPLLEALPNVRRRLVVIDPGVLGGLALRGALRHLRAGGALLHFPAGRIEPDPRVAPPGAPLLAPWKPGLDALLAAAVRALPELRAVPAAVSGVLSRRALAIARAAGRGGSLTDALVPLLQLTLPVFRDVDVRVHLGPHTSPAQDLRASVEGLAMSGRGFGG